MSQTLQFILFLLVGTVLFGSMQYRLYRWFLAWSRGTGDPVRTTAHRRIARWVLVAGNLILFSRFVVSRLGIYDHPAAQILLVYPAGMFSGSTVLGFLVVTVRDIVAVVNAGGRKAIAAVGITAKPRKKKGVEHDHRRREFLRIAGITAAGSIVTLPIISSAATARDYRVNRIDLPFDNLPTGLEGFTIAQVSDIHSGMYMTEPDMREIFEIVNGLHAQTIVLTGDQVDGAVSEIGPMQRAVGMLKAERGIYACLGNHDHYAAADKVASAMRDRNITVLTNEHRRLRIDGAPLAIVGIDDAGGGTRNFARLDTALEGIDPESFTVLLSHRPTIFPMSKRAGVDLTLAGHTHGGQVGVELPGINLNPVYLFYQYAKGLYTEEGKHLYVNVGVGMVGVPIRLVRPEIALFTLRRG